MPPRLNDTERGILDYMVRYLRTHTYQPSIREIGEEFGIKSTKTVSEYLRGLADKGYLERTSSRSRGVRIVGVDLDTRAVTVPCYSRLPDDPSTPGRDGGAQQGVEAHLALDRRLVGSAGSYMVRLRGGELAPLGAREGDIALVEPVEWRDRVKEGDLVVGRLGPDDPGFFRVAREEGRLLARGAQGGPGPYEVITPETGGDGGGPHAEKVEVTGRVVAVHRRLDETPVTMSPTAH